MDVGRTQKIANVVKNITDIGKTIRKPTTLQYAAPTQGLAKAAGLPQPVAGSTAVRIILYLIAGILAVGVILLGIDQWITPIFERTPGDGGYIPMPGIDISEAFWRDTANVKDITLGNVAASPTAAPGSTAAIVPLSTNLLEGQANYGLTMDILIENEFPQTLGKDASNNPIPQRTFFILGPDVLNPTLSVNLDNSVNTLYITVRDSDNAPQSIVIENVPIHKPFRLGISKSPSVMEGYINGLLVKTRPLKTTTKLPTTGSKIFSTANIINNTNVLSTGIKVRYLRIFGYTVSASEMKGRMGDLTSEDKYK